MITRNEVPIIKEIREAPVRSAPRSLKNWLKMLERLEVQLDLDSSSPLVTNSDDHVFLYESLNKVMHALGEVHPDGLSALRREFQGLQEIRRVARENGRAL